jgi:nucleoside-diphosphate-sugar epimerase
MTEACVFGGSGFIGQALVRHLVQDGYAVRVVSRKPSAVAPAAGVMVHEGDVTRPESIDAAVRGASVVFLLIAGGGDRWSDFERSVVAGTAAVARACARHGVRRLVYTSSIAALYLGRRGIVDERVGTDPKAHVRNLYARAKIAAEQVLCAEPIEWVIIRPGLVMGRGGTLNHAGLGMWPSDRYCLGWGAGTNPLPFVLVDDVARAMARAAIAPVGGMSFNLAGDVYMSAREFVQLLAEHSRRAITFLPGSTLRRQTVDVAKWIVKCLARKPENLFPSVRDLRSNQLETALDCSRAKLLLGWQPNADREVFIREAILSHLVPVPSGDLRVAGGLPRRLLRDAVLP